MISNAPLQLRNHSAMWQLCSTGAFWFYLFSLFSEMAESIKIKLPASLWGMTEDNAQFKANKHQKTLDILIL